MAKLSLYKIKSSKLSSLPIKEGQFIVTTDDKKVYLDDAGGQRVALYSDEVNKLSSIASNATRVETSTTNGYIKINGVEVQVYKAPADNNTTYSISKNGSTITLTGSDGSTSTVTDSNTTYSAMTGASTTANGTQGLVPAPTMGNTNRYLSSAGTWTVPTNTTYSNATQTASGLMSSADKKKLDGIEAGAQVNTVTGVKGSSETDYRTGDINITKANIGLGNVENKSSATIRGEITKANVTTALGYTPVQTDTNTTYTLTQDSTDGHKITLTPSTGEATTITIPDNNTTYGVASTTANGLMSKEDKSKLDGVAAGANNYTHPASHPASMITADSTHRFVTDTEKTTWNNKASTSVASTTANGLMSKEMVTKLNSLNNYTLPVASTTLGGVKTTSNVTDNAGYTASPIIDGVVYYKDTNTTYGTASTAANGLMTKEMVTKLNGIATGATANSASSTTPKANGTAAIGTETTFARGDHIHPLQTTVSGNAGSATKLQTARNINGVSFNGTADITVTADPTVHLLSAQNLNDVKTSGFYKGGGSNTVTNKPSGIDSFGLLVYNTAYGYIAQELTGGNALPLKKYIRQYTGSAWSNWTEMKFTDSNTTYSAGTGISLSGTTFSNSGVRSIATGTTNGTISVNTNGTSANVAVKGLAALAYKASLSASDVGAIPTGQKGVANGVASLDENGFIVASQMPSYVDDVIEGYLYNSKFYKESTHTTEITGEAGKIYVNLDNNRTYRWSGSAYAEISASLALGTTSSTAYRGDYGNTAYQHSLKTTGNPHKVTKADVGLGNVDNTADANKTVAHAATADKATDSDTVGGFTVGVNVPANAKFTDNNTTYSAGTGISLSGTTFSNSGVRSVASGTANGTISVNTNGTAADVAVKGLGAMAYKASVSKSDVGLGNVTNYDQSKAIKSITRNGTTFTYTALDGTTGTFTQQDNNTTYSNFKAATASAAGRAGLVPAPAAGKQASFLRGDGTWVVPTNTTYNAMTGATADADGAQGLVPKPTKGNQSKFLRADGTWQTPTNTTYSVATTTANGLMSKDMVTKLNGIAAGAQVNSITGVKGNSETSYRTGNVNITAANIGLGSAIISGSQTTTSTADGGSNIYTFTDVAGTKTTLTVKNGSKGSTGSTGTRGSRWSTGTACTGTSTTATVFATGITDALVNDMYLNTSTGYVYRCTTAGNASTAKWTYIGSIKGATGSQGTKGNTGAAAGFGTPTASVDANTGTPSVTITTSGSNTAKVFNFAFKNLKGAKGAKGDKGDAGTNATTTAVATTTANGLMSKDMVTKLNGIATSANNYTHPTTAGNKHIPSGGSSGQILKWSASGTAVWGSVSACTTQATSLTCTLPDNL